MTDTFWLRADNIAEIMPRVGQSIRAQVAAGKVIEVALKEAKKSKTRQQEKYLHACIGVIARESGENAEHLKVRIKAQVGLIEEVWHKTIKQWIRMGLITIKGLNENRTGNQSGKELQPVAHWGR